MTAAQGGIFTRLMHGIMGLGVLFLVLEVHQLRVAVEDFCWGAGGNDRVERLLASLDPPLRAIGDRLGRVSEALAGPPDVARAMPGAGDRTRPAPWTARDTEATPGVTADRELVAARLGSQLASQLAAQLDPHLESQLASQLQSQLAALVAAVQRIDERPKVHGHSLPDASSPARGADRHAVLRTLAALRTSPLEQSRFLTLTPRELLERYGKPTSIGIDEMGTVSWNYSLDDSWLGFTLYDGRVIYLSYP